MGRQFGERTQTRANQVGSTEINFKGFREKASEWSLKAGWNVKDKVSGERASMWRERPGQIQGQNRRCRKVDWAQRPTWGAVALGSG